MRTLLFTLPLTLFAFAGTKSGPLFKDIQTHWKQNKTYQADYKQTVVSKAMGIPDQSTGKLFISKPDKFRWDAGESGVQIVTKDQLIHIQPKAQRGRTVVDIYSKIGERVDLDYLKLLSGELDIQKRYRGKLLKTKEKSYKIELKPSKAGGETFLAEIDRKSYVLLSLSFENDDNQTTIEFQNTKTNVKLDESLFRYEKKPEDIVNRQ